MQLTTTDRLDIIDLVYRADSTASARNAADYALLFTEEGLLDGAEGTYRGRAAIAQATVPIWAAEGPHSLHVTANPLIERKELPDCDAAVDSVLLIVIDGKVATSARIRQYVAKTDEGWRIARRTVVA